MAWKYCKSTDKCDTCIGWIIHLQLRGHCACFIFSLWLSELANLSQESMDVSTRAWYAIHMSNSIWLKIIGLNSKRNNLGVNSNDTDSVISVINNYFQPSLKYNWVHYLSFCLCTSIPSSMILYYSRWDWRADFVLLFKGFNHSIAFGIDT